MEYTLEEATPMGDRILVLQEKPKEKTSGGIIIPEVAQELPLFGEVVKLGEGEYRDGILYPIPLYVGQRIAFNKYAGKPFMIGDLTYNLMRLADVEIKFEKKVC